MSKISVVINTFNEQENITRALNSVKWADEIIVVDMHSDDKTTEDIKALKDNQSDLHFKLMLTAFIAENTSDKRDEQMKKDLP